MISLKIGKIKLKQITIKQKNKLKDILKKYSNYSDFANNKDDTYKYAKIIGLKICPYCNINYIYTVTEGEEKIVRPDFDHFEPKSRSPEKQLDVDNLVPCCLLCNERLKRAKPFKENTHLNPLKKDFDSIVEFCIDLKNPNYLKEANFDITFNKKEAVSIEYYNLCIANIRDFKLLERYSNHKDTVLDLFKDLKYYYIAKMKEISKLINDENNLSSFIINKIIEYKNIDINNVSLGKLKKDIAIKYSK